MKHILTFDIEEYYEIHGATRHNGKPRVEHGVLKILELLAKYGQKGTFFILGTVAQANPDLVRMIYDQGHEIACHGMTHRLLYTLQPGEAEKQISRAKHLLEQITGEDIKGFRAPCWSIRMGNLKLVSKLQELGFSYDSSLFPAWTWLYGDHRFSRSIRKLKQGIWEVPPSVLGKGKLRIGFSGGIYFRLIPMDLILKGFMHYEASDRPVVTYFHSWEFDDAYIKCINPVYAFTSRFNRHETEERLSKLLKHFSFTRICDFLAL